jgi:cupin 2 domain-containing protein
MEAGADRRWAAGRLTGDVPDSGEAFLSLATVGGARIEHIVSSASPDSAEQVQDWDEWVVVVSGAARLGLPGGELALGPGDWVLIPAGTPHRVLATERGTHWLAVHDRAGAPDPPAGTGDEQR